MALMSAELVLTLTADAVDLDAAGLVEGDGAGTAGVAVWKYEQPVMARAASTNGERII
jgi:hypothetical protein